MATEIRHGEASRGVWRAFWLHSEAQAAEQRGDFDNAALLFIEASLYAGTREAAIVLLEKAALAQLQGIQITGLPS